MTAFFINIPRHSLVCINCGSPLGANHAFGGQHSDGVGYAITCNRPNGGVGTFDAHDVPPECRKGYKPPRAPTRFTKFEAAVSALTTCVGTAHETKEQT